MRLIIYSTFICLMISCGEKKQASPAASGVIQEQEELDTEDNSNFSLDR